MKQSQNRDETKRGRISFLEFCGPAALLLVILVLDNLRFYCRNPSQAAAERQTVTRRPLPGHSRGVRQTRIVAAFQEAAEPLA